MPRSKAQPRRLQKAEKFPCGKKMAWKRKSQWEKNDILVPFWNCLIQSDDFFTLVYLVDKNPMGNKWIPMILRWFCRILWFHDDTGQCYPELKASSPVQIYHVHFHQRSLLESCPTKGTFPKTSQNQQEESTSSPSTSLLNKMLQNRTISPIYIYFTIWILNWNRDHLLQKKHVPPDSQPVILIDWAPTVMALDIQNGCLIVVLFEPVTRLQSI